MFKSDIEIKTYILIKFRTIESKLYLSERLQSYFDKILWPWLSTHMDHVQTLPEDNQDINYKL